MRRLPARAELCIGLMCLFAPAAWAESGTLERFENEKQKMGFKDSRGNVAIAARYDYVHPFTESLALVTKACRRVPAGCDGGKSGMVDRQGREVIALEYDAITLAYSDKLTPLIRVNKGCRIARNRACIGGKWGFVNHRNEIVVPLRYDYTGFFSHGVARVNIGCRVTVHHDDDLPSCSGGKWGFVDDKGALVVPPVYDLAVDFAGGFAKVSRGRQISFIDRAYRLIVPFGKYSEIGFFSDGLAPVKLGDKYGYIDGTGKEVIPFQYASAGDFFQGFAHVKLGHKYGAIAPSGRYIIEPIYDAIEEISGSNVFAATKDGKKGLIHRSGKILSLFRFGGVSRIREAKVIRACDKDSRLCGLVSYEGKLLFEPEFEHIGWLKADFFEVAKGSKRGLARRDGEIVVPLIYDYIDSISAEDLIAVTKDEKAGYINTSGEVVVPLQYERTRRFEFGRAVVAKKMHGSYSMGVIDPTGRVIIPIEHPMVSECYENGGPIFVQNHQNKWAIFSADGVNLSGFVYDEYGTSSSLEPGERYYIVNIGKRVMHLNKFGKCIRSCG